MRNRIYAAEVALSLILILSSCSRGVIAPLSAETQPYSQVSLPSTFITETPSPTSRSTFQELAPTITQTTEIVSSASAPGHTPTALSLNIQFDEIKEKGSIWFYLGDEKRFWVVDLDHQLIYPFETPSDYLCWNITSNSPWIFCLPDDRHRQVNIINLLSGEKEVFSFTGIEIGQVWRADYFPDQIFYTMNPKIHSNVLYSYNTITQISQPVATLPGNYQGILPKLSADGKYFVGVIDQRLVQIDILTGEIIPLTPKNLHVTPNFDISSAAPITLFGVTDLHLDTMELANYIYAMNLNERSLELIAIPTANRRNYDEFLGPKWSPDGKSFFTISGNAICVMDFESREEKCGFIDVPKDTPYFQITSANWSPSGKYISLVVYPSGFDSDGDLMIFSIETRKFYHVIHDQRVGGGVWRELGAGVPSEP